MSSAAYGSCWKDKYWEVRQRNSFKRVKEKKVEREKKWRETDEEDE